jgi:hypothetical protein
MKKILFFLLVLFCIPFSIYGINGNGSFASPYNGPLTSDMNWSGTVYVDGDVTVNGFTLTISPGATIIFIAAGSDLIITGTGVLTASGSGSSNIRFTADFNNNGIYGETGERWGHIVFWNMNVAAGSSLLNYCIIEYGDVSSLSNTTSYGGGIFIRSFSLVTISNCIIINNKATHGGGIMALKDGANPVASPTITNSKISQNTAVTSGGGIYLHTGCVSSITNCIVNNNTTGAGGGGGIFLDGCSNVRVFNSDFVTNTTSNSARGYNVQYYNVNNTIDRPRFTNCIVWSSDNSITHLNATYQISDFVNCAIQDVSTPASSYTNCINISGSNGDPTGPNFTAPGSFDYSIMFISPCRDAGISSGAPVTDYAGKSRIYNYDIGAYEVQYSRWTGASGADWANPSNWEANADPSIGSGDVYIPVNKNGDYPTSDPSQDFTISAGKFMILEPTTQASLGTLTNNGTLKLNGSIAGTSSLILTNYVKGGGATEEIQLFLYGGGTKTPLTYKWHYISSPFTSLSVSSFAPSVTLDLAQWIETMPSLSLSQGWVAYDGYYYSTGGMGGPTFSSLVPGKGYDFWDSADNTFSLSGQLNTSDVSANLSYTSGNDALHGYNLLGNPFTSGLDWDYIISNSFPANTTKSLYFTRNSALCTYINGVGVPSDVNGIIPPMQGFFSKTYSAGNSIILAAAARTHNNIHSTYKGNSVIPLVRLSLADDTFSDETVVRFDNLAKSYLDNDFDAVKMFLDPDLTSIYTSLAGTNYAINGLPFPDTFIEIPVTINLLSESATKTITASQIQGLEGYNVTLKDNTTGFTADLKGTPSISFSAAKGSITGRFVLRIGAIPTGIENPATTLDKFNIYSADNIINIQTLADEWNGKIGSVRILDLNGRIKSDTRNVQLLKNSLLQVEAPGAQGMYIVEINSGLMRYVGKVIIR